MSADRGPARPALTLSEFDFALPPDLIAQHPLTERTSSRLLHVAGDQLHDSQFTELSDLLRPGDLLVLNNTRVIRARFFGRKASGGNIEVLIERIVAPHQALAMIRASKSPKPGSTIRLADAFDCTVTGRAGENDEFFALSLPPDSADWWTLAEGFGRLPLPPYIEHSPDSFDEERYQTVYSQHAGAVAAPTAGLHFDDGLFERLQKNSINAAFLTLHVGAGTFQPVRVENLAEHRMHREHYEIPPATVAAIRAAKHEGRRIVAVGTTSLRALESAAAASTDGLPQAGAAESGIFITPGFEFKVVDALITNFHLPKSTLLMLVSAFAGMDNIRRAYTHAIAERYRFFSYGDAMLLEKQKDAENPR
jgi:S-adenosylmethionine:tRNA ribosyltransferase-isomerase